MKNWIILIILNLLFCLEACNNKPTPSELSIAESIIKECPDSTLALLYSIANITL